MDLPNVAGAETDSALKQAIGSEFVVNAASKKYVRVDCLDTIILWQHLSLGVPQACGTPGLKLSKRYGFAEACQRNRKKGRCTPQIFPGGIAALVSGLRT